MLLRRMAALPLGVMESPKCVRGLSAGTLAVRRAVALDMDGTTLNSKQALTPSVVDAIQRVSAAGVQVIIATGRPAQSLRPYVEELALPDPVPAVCFNGACAMMMGPRQEEMLFAEPLQRETAAQVIELCRSEDWCPSYCRSNGPAIAAPKHAQHESLLTDFERLEGTKQTRVPDLMEVLSGGGELPLKLVIMASDPEKSAARARAAMPVDLVHVIAAEVHIEFISPKVNKGKTLARLCGDVLRLRLEDVIAFGDNHNDVEMLTLVGEGVAMSNAKEAAKAAAARVCQWSNDEEGVAKELCELLAAGRLAPPETRESAKM